MTDQASKKDRRRRAVPLLWASGAVAAAVLVLGVNGTLSSWTTAIIHNDTDTVQAADAVVLTETSGSASCVSTDDGTNEDTCSTINKYGGTGTPLSPNEDQSVTVTMKNTGTTSGSLTLSPGACSKVTGSGSSLATESICDVATVTVACTAPSSVDTTSAPVVLNDFSSATTIGTLAAGASTSCTFDVALPNDASAQIAGQIASQPLDWTLTAAA